MSNNKFCDSADSLNYFISNCKEVKILSNEHLSSYLKTYYCKEKKRDFNPRGMIPAIYVNINSSQY